MTTEITAPELYDPRPWERVTLAEQRPAIDALAELAAALPNLPGAYITTSAIVPGQIEVQALTFAAFEAWREGLGVDPGDVRPGNMAPERAHLELDAVVGGVPVHVYAMGAPLPQTAAESEGGAA
ncbi:hypothetical protein [Streptomyces sp. NPDC050560]|uniref:hypothetical protein n=1 Tax=Streptomyces sp. NPDC050560 TaxID=3365630 RepID=UPI0037BCEA3A